ncbi:hypothetical protein ACOJBM_41215 [Rhizobium beringeri]
MSVHRAMRSPAAGADGVEIGDHWRHDLSSRRRHRAMAQVEQGLRYRGLSV